MQLVWRYWRWLLLWAGSILLLLAGVSLASGQAAAEVLAYAPGWGALAVSLAAFPAGIAVNSLVFPGGRLDVRAAVRLAVAAASVSLLALALVNLVGPLAARASPPGRPAAEDVYVLSLVELRAAARDAAARASVAGEPRAWLEANRLMWHYARRTGGAALPFLFGLLGAAAGFWSARFGRREWVLAQRWALGVVLLVGTYLVGENSYELIVLRAAGPVFFAGDLVLVPPALLLLGLGWPTLVATWGGPWERTKGSGG